MNQVGNLVAVLTLGVALAGATSCAKNTSAQATANTGATRTAVLDVVMPCASCSLSVHAALKRLNGVSDTKVSVSKRNATVQYDPAKVTPQQMIDAVNKLGYPASLAARGS